MHHFISPLWASTTWNSWMRSRFVACDSSSRSQSPRVPTSENARNSRSAAKSSQAARNSRLPSARSSSVEAAPGRIHGEEGVLDEVALGHGAHRIGSSFLRPVKGSRRRTGTVGPEGYDESDADRPGLPIFLDVSGWRDAPHRGACRGAPRGGARGARTRAVRRGRPPRGAAAPWRAAAAARGAGVARAARAARSDGGPNGAVSNLLAHPVRRRRRCGESSRPGGFDVVHVHEPVTPVVGWDALTSTPTRRSSAPSTATPSTSRRTWSATLLGARRKLNHLARPHRGLRGRGLDRAPLLRRRVPDRPQRRGDPLWRRARAARTPPPGSRCGSRSSARPWSARACRSCCARSRRCARRFPPSSWSSAPPPPTWRRCWWTPPASRCSGRVGDEEKHAALARRRRARRALARRRVVRDGADGGVRGRHARRGVRHRRLPRRGRATASTALLVPRGDATALAEALRDLALDPARTARARRRGAAVTRRALRVARVAERVVDGLRGRASRAGSPRASSTAPPCASGSRPPTSRPRRPARRLPSLEPAPGAPRRRGRARAALGLGRRRRRRSAAPTWRCSASASTAIGQALVHSSPAWVLVGLALMCASMVLRGGLLARDPQGGAAHAHGPGCADAMQGTAIGVLMSATLPARLGEPSRALIVARRLGRAARARCPWCSARSSRRRCSTSSRW